jgi:hypothetical protein
VSGFFFHDVISLGTQYTQGREELIADRHVGSTWASALFARLGQMDVDAVLLAFWFLCLYSENHHFTPTQLALNNDFFICCPHSVPDSH